MPNFHKWFYRQQQQSELKDARQKLKELTAIRRRGMVEILMATQRPSAEKKPS